MIIAILITLVGIATIYSGTYQKEGKQWQEIYKRQVAWACMGLFFFFLMSNLHYRRLWDATYILYGLCLFLLLTVFILGIVRLGAQRWLKIAWLNFQPSEMAKLATVLFLSRYFSKKSVESMSLMVGNFRPFRGFILPLIFILIPMGLVIEQPDLGSGIMILFIFLMITYLAGVRLRYLLTFISLILVSMPLAWHFLREYQRDRLMVFLNPNIDPLGAGYTIIQAKIAIGSGAFFGKGWLSGTQSQLHFLPESHTDFIFATFAEEWGFLGSCALLLLYYLLIRQGMQIAMRTSDYYGRLLAFGVSLALAVQVAINIAMNLGLAPVVGIPLPLMSYGGSSLFMTYISLGILANIAKTRTAY
jgi:rod shape determining protein RodA